LELSLRVCGPSGFNIRKIFPPASFQSKGVETLGGTKSYKEQRREYRKERGRGVEKRERQRRKSKKE
jgi:hypothetical protein